MKKLCLIFLILALLTGCAAPAASETTEAAPASAAVTFTDDLGRTVTVSQPKKVAALLGSFAQIWQLAGGEVCATPDDAWEDLGLTLAPDTVNLGNLKKLSLELLLSSEPELILASSNTRQHMEWKDTLEATGIPVAYFSVSNFQDYLRMLEICAQITGQPEKFQASGTAVQAQIDTVLQRSEARGTAPTVLCMRASATLITVKNSQDNVLGEMLHHLGCVNIADSDSSLLENISIERILEADPDFIFIVQRGNQEGMVANVESMMRENPAWLQLTAVKEGRLYYMDKNLYNLKPNHRWGEAYEKLEDILENG